MNAKFNDVIWNKGDSNVYTGYRDGRKPSGAIRGGNGTFLVMDNPSQLILELDTPKGLLSQDIISQVKREKEWKKLSEKRVQKLEKAFANADWEVSDDGRIMNLKENLALV